IAGSEAPISASLSGADLVILAPTIDHLLFEVYTRPDLTTPAEFRGKRLGITRVGSSTDFAARQWVRSIGLRPAHHVPPRPMGGQPEILAGLQNGAIDGGILSPPGDVRARQVGLREMANLVTLDVPFYQSSVLVTRRAIDERPDVVRRFVRAIVEANAIIHQDP